jgi:hypothetical protein
MQLCRERNSCRNLNRIKIKNASTSYRQRDTSKKFNRRCAQNNHDKNISKRRTKKKIIARKKKIEFRQIFKSFIDSLSRFWCLIVWAKNKNHKSRKIFKISALTEKNAIKVVLEMIEDFAFKTKMLHKHFFSNMIKTNFLNLQTFIYRSAVTETKSRIQKNEIKQIIKCCKLNNVSEFDDISNKILKILCTE